MPKPHCAKVINETEKEIAESMSLPLIAATWQSKQSYPRMSNICFSATNAGVEQFLAAAYAVNVICISQRGPKHQVELEDGGIVSAL